MDPNKPSTNSLDDGELRVLRQRCDVEWRLLRQRNASYRLIKTLCLVGVLLLCFVESSSSSVAFDYVPKPEFLENRRELNVTSFIGHIARLPCTIRHLGTKRVSWIRGKDLQVLATGRKSFVTDIRISVLKGTGTPKKQRRSITSDLQGTSEQQYIPQERTTLETLIHNQGERKRRSFINYSPSYSRDNLHSYSSNLHITRQQNPKLKFQDAEKIQDEPRFSQASLQQNPYFTRSKRTKEKSSNPPKQGDDGPKVKIDKNGAPQPKNLSHLGQEDLQGSIAIHPSGSDMMSNDGDSKRTIVPYNYLEGVWEPEDYTLQIKFADKADAGEYICQINTEPRMSQVVRLSVVDMIAEIVGRKEFIVKEGSPVTLTCKIAQGGVLPGFIFWYKQDKLVDYVNSNGRIEIKTTPQGRSELLLKKAVAQDSANYTCQPAGGKSASATLNVIKDERPPLMKKGNGCGRISLDVLSLAPLLILQNIFKDIRFKFLFIVICMHCAMIFTCHDL